MPFDCGDFDPRRVRCDVCEGTGRIVLYGFNCSGRIIKHTSTTCWLCEGVGSLDVE